MAYGVGIIGSGLQGIRRARALSFFKDFQISMVADIDEDAARRLSEEVGSTYTLDWREVVEREDIDVVIVCTPPNLHAEISVAAMEHGKHVLCEKPLARTVEEGQNMVRVAQKNGLKLGCGFNLRHHRGVQQIHTWIEEGSIGQVSFVRCRYGIGGREGYENDWRTDPETSGGGELMDQGVHALDLSRWFLGDVAEVTGILQTAFWPIAPIEDNAFALLRNRKGSVASLHVSWTQWRPLFSLEIYGSEGYAVVEGLGGAYGDESARLGQRDFTAPFAEKVVHYRGEDPSWKAELQDFLEAISEGREPLANGVDGVEALKLVQAVYHSAEQKQTLTLQ